MLELEAVQEGLVVFLEVVGLLVHIDIVCILNHFFVVFPHDIVGQLSKVLERLEPRVEALEFRVFLDELYEFLVDLQFADGAVLVLVYPVEILQELIDLPVVSNYSRAECDSPISSNILEEGDQALKHLEPCLCTARHLSDLQVCVFP